MRLRCRWFVGGWLWLTSGCDEPEPSADEIEAREQETAVDELTAAICTAVDACECGASAAPADCSASEPDTWRARLLAGRSRGLVWDGACVEAIDDAVGAAQCDRASSGSSHPCADYCAVFHGDRELGETCEAFDELVSDCAQGLMCAVGRCVEPCSILSGLPVGARCSDPATNIQLQSCAQGLWCDSRFGRCAAPPLEGSPCNDSGCGPDSYCDWQSTTCRGLPREGESCWESPDCAADLACVYDQAYESATCFARSEIGETCSDRPCATELSCDSSSICRGPAELGEACNDVQCRDELVCDAGTICREPPGVGEGCGNGICESQAWCDFASPEGPVCVAGAADGVACSGHVQCGSGYCPKGTCEARPDLGDDCSQLFVCAPGLSCDGSTCRPTITAAPAVCVYEGW